MKLNKSRDSELVFKTICIFKNRVTKITFKKTFCMDHITKYI